jgi:hypothetical protein
VTASAGQSAGYGWLVSDFVQRVAGVAHAVIVEPDGRMRAGSRRLPPERAEQLCSIAARLMRLTEEAAASFKGGAVAQTMVEMELGYLFLMSIGDGSALATLASPRCDLGEVAYEMTTLVDVMNERLGTNHAQ